MAETNLNLVRKFFFAVGEKITTIKAQWDKLTDDDKVQLGEAIRNGSLNY